MSFAEVYVVAGALSIVIGGIVLFALGFFFGWRLAVRRILCENEDLSAVID